MLTRECSRSPWRNKADLCTNFGGHIIQSWAFSWRTAFRCCCWGFYRRSHRLAEKAPLTPETTRTLRAAWQTDWSHPGNDALSPPSVTDCTTLRFAISKRTPLNSLTLFDKVVPTLYESLTASRVKIINAAHVLDIIIEL